MKTKLLTAAVAAALMMPLAGYSQDRSPMTKDTTPPAVKKENGGAFSDAAITSKIKAEYAKDKEVSAMSIHVDTDKGVVKLGGTAKSQTEADKAVSIAKGVQGVSSVKNEIKVQPK